ncbi:hypothetical protein HBI81_243760 [Parastagonospora nodorum]|nr:hypothetical protein HBI18_246260 [Parastagonospora nodorum]KAH6511569.1 hypothetical protein HBI81_243760 [Parastagonospora nodorum]
MKLAIIEAFEKEYTAKAFYLIREEMRRKWVQKELQRRRNDLVGKEIEEDEFDSIMAAAQWNRDGVLVLEKAIEDGGVGN